MFRQDDGVLLFNHDFRHHTTEAKKGTFFRPTLAAQDNSVYIGSSRLSYDRSNHQLQIQSLKSNHIPLYMQGRGMDAAHLPTGVLINDMSVADWFIFARDHFVEEHLHVHDGKHRRTQATGNSSPPRPPH